MGRGDEASDERRPREHREQMNVLRELTDLKAAACAFLLFSTGLALGEAVVWKAGEGSWDDAAKWGGAVPSVTSAAEIAGDASVVIERGDVAVSRLDLGTRAGSAATLTMSGGALATLEFIRLGEAPGSHGRFVLHGGLVRTMELAIGGLEYGGGETPACGAEMEIRGGSVLTRYLEVGTRIGSAPLLRVVGSKAESIVALNSIYFANATGSVGSASEMCFDLDAAGVTPLILWSRQNAITLSRKDRAGRCTLRIGLLDAPPRGDVVLMQSFKPCAGTFHDLPEGSIVRAAHAGRTFEWRLTYRGGASHCDIVLCDPHEITASGERLAYTSGQPARVVRVESAAIRKMWEAVYPHIDRVAPPPGTGTLAFPGAEGHGAYARGGRVGKALFVTNLNDSGPGSLRAAIDAKGPRTVIFRVGGVIELKQSLTIREPFITIAGQTAPGDGICLRGAPDTLSLVNTHDVIVRYLRVRHGHTGDSAADEGDCIACYSADNFILDHCSVSWGTDEGISVTQSSDRYTVQWCIIAEGLNYRGHSMGSILGGDRSTWHHNLFAHCRTRNPRFAGLCRADFRNNVIYDWGDTSGYGDFRAANYVNNFLKPGPSTTQKPPRFIHADSVVMPGSLFLRGNVLAGFPDVSGHNPLGAAFDQEVFADAPHAAPPVVTQSADEAFALVLKNAGAIVPPRDATDARITADVRGGTGQIIRLENELGAWPAYANGKAPPDADNDGVPDAWETAHGLNANDPDDANRANADGYTNLENYLNSLATHPQR